MFRPKIAVPGRFTDNASALRYRGVVSARALLEGVWQAGGDPVTLLPATGEGASDWAARLAGFDGVLLPGGGDVIPARYGQPADHPSLYGMDEDQDETDFTLARYALENAIPMLAICRGLHVVNILHGGSLVIDMDVHHRHHLHTVELNDPTDHLGFGTPIVHSSCYHHQAVDRLGDGLTVLGRSEDGYVEAVQVAAPAWAAALQWHPEDTFFEDDVQLQPLRRLVNEARAHAGR